MRAARWALGGVVLLAVLALIIFRTYPVEFLENVSDSDFAARALYIVLLSALLCLFRIARGPTSADRIMAIDILGILIVGFCAIMAAVTDTGWYLDIGIAWALQSFIASLAFSKYLESRRFDP